MAESNAYFTNQSSGHIKELFQDEVTPSEHRAGILIMVEIRKLLSHEKTKAYIENQSEKANASKRGPKFTEAGASKLRYLGADVLLKRVSPASNRYREACIRIMQPM